MNQDQVTEKAAAFEAHRAKLKEHFSGYGQELLPFLTMMMQANLSYSAIAHHAINGYSATLSSEEMLEQMLGLKPAPLRMAMNKLSEHMMKLNVRVLIEIANSAGVPKQVREDTFRDVMLAFAPLDEGGTLPELTDEDIKNARENLFAEYLAVPTLQ